MLQTNQRRHAGELKIFSVWSITTPGWIQVEQATWKSYGVGNIWRAENKNQQELC